MPGGVPWASSVVPLSMRPGATWRDQVPRRAAFERAHPEVTITSGGDPLRAPDWCQARIPDGDTVEYVTKYELSDLLDVLEERFPPDTG